MKKNLLIAAIAITALASCSSNDYVGDQSPQTSSGTNGAISFTSGIPAVTRTSGATAAASLNNNFVVFGYKTVNSTPQKVFDNYQVNYVTSSENTTTSNSAGWEYVGYKNLPGGITTNVGVTAFAALTGSGLANESAIDQSIKYWDFAATSYDFFAYSLGTSNNSNWAKASALNMTGYGESSAHPGYTLTGNQTQLGACYISKKRHIDSPSTPVTAVDLTFVNFLSKIQLKFFETIPGYSVKDLKFYNANDTKSTGDAGTDGLKPALYGAANCISTAGTYIITFDANNDPVVTLSSAASPDSKVEFDAITTPPNVWLSGFAGRDYKETEETVYLGRAANAATSTSQISVFPNSTGVALTLKMDYTLVSRDGTGETLQVTGATATIPAVYTAWKPNYAYTYIFKITDDKLVPITLDAIVTETIEGNQTTITTVDNPSITTYQNGTINDEYYAGTDIYVVVGDNTALSTSNIKLYTASLTLEAGENPKPAIQEITEATVANALAHSGSVTDANGATLAVTAINSGTDALSILNADTEVNGISYLADKAAKFTPSAPTAPAPTKYYVLEYIDGSSNKHYKVIKVVAAPNS